MNLLSDNDYSALSVAMRRMEPLTLTRALGSREITVSVRPAPPVWRVAMVAQVRVKEGCMEFVQTVESVEKAREIIGKNQISVVGIHQADLVPISEVYGF